MSDIGHFSSRLAFGIRPHQVCQYPPDPQKVPAVGSIANPFVPGKGPFRCLKLGRIIWAEFELELDRAEKFNR